MTGLRGTGGDIKKKKNSSHYSDHHGTDNNSNNSRLYNNSGIGSKEKATSSIRSIYTAFNSDDMLICDH